MTKGIIIPAVIIAATITFVTASSIASCYMLTTLSDELAAADSTDDYRALSKRFEKYEIYLSFAIGDNALSDIRMLMYELIAYAEAESDDETAAAKNRLYSRLEEQRRLSGLNFASVF